MAKELNVIENVSSIKHVFHENIFISYKLFKRNFFFIKTGLSGFQETCLYFDEVKRTRTPPYCFECMIALVTADYLTIDTQSSDQNNTPFLSEPLLEVLLRANSMRTDGFSFTAHFRSL